MRDLEGEGLLRGKDVAVGGLVVGAVYVGERGDLLQGDF